MSVLRTVCFALAVLTAGAEAADTYPSKPIRFVVAFPPGGGTDLVARTIAPRLAERLAQQVVVDNRPGAGGNLGTEIVAKSAPDGYTMLMGSVGPLAINASLLARLPFDPLKDLAPVTLAASTPNILVVHPSLPVASVHELIALAKARPGAINFASSGQGTPAQLAGELFNSMAGVKMVHVPYKGAAPALADLLGGQVQVMFSTMPPALPHVSAGRCGARRGKPEALAGRARAADRRRGGAAGIRSDDLAWRDGARRHAECGLTELTGDIVAVLRMPDVAERLSSQGAEAIGSTPQEFASYIKTETAKWAKVIRESGAKAE